MKNLNFPLFFSMMLVGIIITMNSSSWISAWIGMELNILGFLPMIMDYKNSYTHEIIMKYFLISSLSSMVVLFFTFYMNNFWMFTNSMNFNLPIMLALGLKLGAAPFHNWFITFISHLNPTMSFWLMTLQKLPPLFLMNFNPLVSILMFFMIFSSIFGSLGGFHQTNIMKLLAYSSISHLAWIMICIMYFNSLWLMYFLIYFLMLTPIIVFVQNNKLLNLNLSMNIQSSSMIMLYISLLSLAGFPPLLGFFPKLYIIMILTNMHSYTILMILIFSSIINLYFYIRLSYNFLFIYTLSLSNMNKFSNYISMNIMSILSPILFFLM